MGRRTAVLYQFRTRTVALFAVTLSFSCAFTGHFPSITVSCAFVCRAVVHEPVWHKCMFLFRALNYGAIGTILGHELTHGFDNSGDVKTLHQTWSKFPDVSPLRSCIFKRLCGVPRDTAALLRAVTNSFDGCSFATATACCHVRFHFKWDTVH